MYVCIGLRSFNPCLAQRENEEPDVLPLSTAYVLPPGWTAHKEFYTTVNWEGRQYGTSEGIRVLMRVITDESTHPDERAKALETLGTVWPWLRNTDRIPTLIALYDTLTGREEKLGVLACLTGSEDPRGLPLLTQVLENKQDDLMRLGAACALAQWNVRRGVAELIVLLESEATLPQDARAPRVRDNALDMFMSYNRRKGWGFSEDRIRQEYASGVDPADLADEQKWALGIAGIKKWFAENKNRFPDWELGDPVPPAETLPAVPPIPGPEDVLALSAAFLEPPAYGKLGRGDRGYLSVGQRKEEEVSWEGKRYPAAEGAELLMKVVLEPGSAGDRWSALRHLEQRLGSQLRNTERVPQLVELYERLTHWSEKVALLFCLAESRDARALPLFAEILQTRQEEDLRLPAAYGLALWNVRRGAGELIELLSVKEAESPIHHWPGGVIGEEAAHFLYRVNYWKSWWAPQAPLEAVFEARTGLDDEVLDSCHAELKKWFADNEHRFPDWKLGDPLPEVAPPESTKSAGE